VGSALNSPLQTIEQIQDDSDSGQVHFEFFVEGADYSRSSKRAPIVERLCASAALLDSDWREEIFLFPEGQLALADSAHRAECASAHQHDFAASATPAFAHRRRSQ